MAISLQWVIRSTSQIGPLADIVHSKYSFAYLLTYFLFGSVCVFSGSVDRVLGVQLIGHSVTHSLLIVMFVGACEGSSS